MQQIISNFSQRIPTFDKRKAFFWVVGIVIFLIAFSIINPIVIIPAGHRGVTLRLGAVVPIVRGEGLSLRIPVIDKVVKVDVRTKKIEWNETNRMAAVSKDLQDVFVESVVNYHPIPDNVSRLYQEIGLDYQEIIIKPLALQVTKTHTAKYNVTEILQNREKITNDVNQDLRYQLNKYNIILDEVTLTNIDFRPEYKQAIEAKQIAEKEVETQKFKLDKQGLEAQQVVKQAEAQKQAKVLEGEGIKIYNQSISLGLTPEILRFKEIENQEKAIGKWSGTYPTTVVGGNSVPLIQIGKQ